MTKELLQAIIDAPQCLTAQMDAAEGGERRRDVLFYSGAKVPRMDWWTGEEYDLSFAMDGADLKKLKDGPVLNGHADFQVQDVLGVVENPRRSERGYEASLRFSDRDEVAGVWKDIEDGILRSVSMGVNIKKIELKEDDKKNKRKHYMATEWEPFEISVVPRGADPGAKFLAADPRLLELRGGHIPADIDMAKLAEDVVAHFRKLSGSAVSPTGTDSSEDQAREALALRQRRYRVLGH
jgi:hypothetical protein